MKTSCVPDLLQDHLKSGYRRKKILVGKRLSNQRRRAVSSRQALWSVTADEGEAQPARYQRIGDAARRLPAEMGIQQRAPQRPSLDGGQSIFNRAHGACDGKARILERGHDIEGNEEFVFNDENGGCVGHWSLVLGLPARVTVLSLEIYKCRRPSDVLSRLSALARKREWSMFGAGETSST